MKIVKEKLEEKEEVFEGFRIGNKTYDNIKAPDGNVWAGEEGILGNNGIHIPWKLVQKLLVKFTKS